MDQYCVLLRLLHPVLVSLKCDNLPLSKLPLTAEVFSVFAKAGTDKALSDGAAFFDLILIYDYSNSIYNKANSSQNGGIQMRRFTLSFP